MVKNNVLSKDAQCFETDSFLYSWVFFCATFSFWDVANFVFDINSELVWDFRDEPDSDANQDFCEPGSDANQ